MKIFALAGVLLLVPITSGCATNFATKVGGRTERLAVYQAVYLSGDVLSVRYSSLVWPEATFETNPRFVNNPERWASGSLSALKWVPLEALDRAPFEILQVERGHVSIADETGHLLPLRHQPPMSTRDVIAVLARDHTGTISVHVRGDSPLILVRRDLNQPNILLVARASPPEIRHYNENWAPYARAALIPFALVTDVLTAPIQIIALIVIALGQRH
jgi:hypothetical protein